MKKNQDSDDTVSEHCVGMFWARLDFVAPTTPGGNALEADEGAKQWARLVAKKPASPKRPAILVQAANRVTANGEHGPGDGNSLKKTARSLKNAALRRAKVTFGRVFGYL